ncbi:SbcC/MukB-like Walker B domain-containing protein [Companilactobacillus versmoldensis]|uniref:Chromosome segregation ATPase n=1 Tax=Companilactobacillus versmoldensis DSM 14857 = KCTC 3814 TaxID=1423815 RepID=A0A0R1SED1_9LACO|nr:SbcC/MukB-like Walker B domain-containing protein [Companilactobacillus versmoldensis]KRL67599.1 chromosome segregation ATPase [Companilactobacillus versmoldensis DSM 14857 = KCTC 3814]
MFLKDEFSFRNADLGNEFRVFSQVSEFQSYVANNIYGFNDVRSLHQLANAYQLLASPILTAGNSRLTPILEAMKNAQEGIDAQIIESVADTQREVNRKRSTLDRIERGKKKLIKMKKEIFWRNLNRLQEKFLEGYGNQSKNLSEQKVNKEQLEKALDRLVEQLKILKPKLEQAQSKIQKLLQKQAQQKILEDQRQDKKNQKEFLEVQIRNYLGIIKQLHESEENLAKALQVMDSLNAEKEIIDNKISPIKQQLFSQLSNLTQLDNGFSEFELSKQIEQLKHYIRKMKNLQKDYQNLVDNKNRLSEDIKIVSEMRENMDEKIDLRASGPVVGRIKPGLHQDNKDVHDAGAAKMSYKYKLLEQKRLDLLSDNADLQKFIDNAELPSLIRSLVDDLDTLNKTLTAIQQKIDKKEAELAYISNDISKIKATLNQEYDGFDVEVKKAEIQKLEKEIASLIIDDNLDNKILSAKDDLEQYEKSQTQLNNDKIKNQADIDNLERSVKQTEKLLTNYKDDTERNLRILKPYMIEDYQLLTIDENMKFLTSHKTEVRNNTFSELSEKIGRIIRNSNQNGIDSYALDSIFEERGYSAIASLMRKNRSINEESLVVVPFDINQAQKILDTDGSAVEKSLSQLKSGNVVAQTTYLEAAVHQISDQYDLIDGYNKMLTHGVSKSQGIQLKVSLKPKDVDIRVIEEARDTSLTERPNLLRAVQNRLERLASDITIADDDELFIEEAQKLLDIRQWSDFQIWIHRKQAEVGEFELVDDKFVQSGGSGAEKAQSMVLPLLLVPKMILNRSKFSDAPHLIMFDEFADKLDPETAKSFARTIDQFGFNFLATMPSGSQNKILADGVDNIAYDVIPPKNKNDGRFHENEVREAVIWTKN